MQKEGRGKKGREKEGEKEIKRGRLGGRSARGRGVHSLML